jgi:hypothetical protein
MLAEAIKTVSTTILSKILFTAFPPSACSRERAIIIRREMQR